LGWHNCIEVLGWCSVVLKIDLLVFGFGRVVGSLSPCSFRVVGGCLLLVLNFNVLLKEEEFLSVGARWVV